MTNLVIHSADEFSLLYEQLSEEDRFSLFSYLEFLISRKKKLELQQAILDARKGENLTGDFSSGEDAVKSMLMD